MPIPTVSPLRGEIEVLSSAAGDMVENELVRRVWTPALLAATAVTLYLAPAASGPLLVQVRLLVSSSPFTEPPPAAVTLTERSSPESAVTLTGASSRTLAFLSVGLMVS